MKALAEKMPDGLPAGFPDGLFEHTHVIPVPVSGIEPCSESKNKSDVKSGKPIEIVWNHRWEHDKQPQVFFAALEKLIARRIDCKVHVMGQSFREVPDCFETFQSRFGSYIETWGYQPADNYGQILHKAHFVVSSALHDFQGLGIQEAISAGCMPVVPDRMAYPEYIPEELRYRVTAAGTDLMVICLLYTSPSPRDATLSRMPSSA